MINTSLSASLETSYLEPFEDRIDILFHELELATKWQRPSVLWAIYSSEYVRADADITLERRLRHLGQNTYHIKIDNPKNADVSLQIAELAKLGNMVFFVEGLRWGAGMDERYTYHRLDNNREYLIDNRIRIVFWLTEKEAIDLAHYAPEYWALRHRVIEFVDSPRPDQISPHVLESAWRGTGEFTDSTEDLDDKIALRTALLTDLPAGDESTDTRANLLLTLGILHWRRGDFERATQFLNSALDLAARLEDDYFEALCFNAIALVKTDLGRIEEAVQAYKNAIGLSPEQIFPWNNLGYLYRRTGNYAEALAAFQKAIELNGSDAVAWNGLGDVYQATRRNDEAIHAYLKAIEFSPDYAHSWSGLGNSHKAEKRLEEALEAYRKAIEIDRRTINSWLGLGEIYRMQGDDENAGMAYRTALELDPQNSLAWNESGHLSYKTGAYDEAMHAYMKCIELNQGSYTSYGNLAHIYILKGLYTEAIPILLKGLDLTDDITGRASLWNRLGDVYKQLEDYENAFSAYQKAEALASDTAISQTGSSPSISDPLPSSSTEIPAKPELQPGPDPVLEKLLLSEASKPASLNPPENPVVPIEPPAAPKAQEFNVMDWLNNLATAAPEASQGELAESAASDPILEEHAGAVQEGGTEDGSQAVDGEKPTSPEEKAASLLDGPALAFPDRQVFLNLPFEEEILTASPQILNPEQNMEGTEPAMAKSDENKTEFQESAIKNEDHALNSMTEADDNNPPQVAINEKNAQIWNELGNIYFNTGAIDEAMHAFEMAIELDPLYGWSYNNLGSIHFHLKHYEEAIRLFQKSLKLLDGRKDKALLWNRIGDAYRRLNSHDQAVTAYRKAMELDPHNVSLLTRARFSLLGNIRA